MPTQTQGKWQGKNSLSEIKTQRSIRDNPTSQVSYLKTRGKSRNHDSG